MPRIAGRQPAHGVEAVVSLAEVAAELGCSKQRAQQIETRVLSKLRGVLAQRSYVMADLIDAFTSLRAGPKARAAATMPVHDHARPDRQHEPR
jgi:hypothetical protein